MSALSQTAAGSISSRDSSPTFLGFIWNWRKKERTNFVQNGPLGESQKRHNETRDSNRAANHKMACDALNAMSVEDRTKICVTYLSALDADELDFYANQFGRMAHDKARET